MNAIGSKVSVSGVNSRKPVETKTQMTLTLFDHRVPQRCKQARAG